MDNDLIMKALEKAEYETLKKKAMLNQIVIQAGKNGEIVRVPAREVFQKLYNEPVPEFWELPLNNNVFIYKKGTNKEL